MNGIPRLCSRLSRKDTAWICSSCAIQLTRRKPSTSFYNPSTRRAISDSSKSRQNVAPTMEQLRSPFKTKNSSTLYYTLSIILGTVAFSYGSVPMYKMVRKHHPTTSTIHTLTSRRYAKPQAGVANPSKPPGTAASKAETPLSA